MTSLITWLAQLVQILFSFILLSHLVYDVIQFLEPLFFASRHWVSKRQAPRCTDFVLCMSIYKHNHLNTFTLRNKFPTSVWQRLLFLVLALPTTFIKKFFLRSSTRPLFSPASISTTNKHFPSVTWLLGAYSQFFLYK